VKVLKSSKQKIRFARGLEAANKADDKTVFQVQVFPREEARSIAMNQRASTPLGRIRTSAELTTASVRWFESASETAITRSDPRHTRRSIRRANQGQVIPPRKRCCSQTSGAFTSRTKGKRQRLAAPSPASPHKL